MSNYICQKLNSNLIPLVLEVTTLPTVLQPLPIFRTLQIAEVPIADEAECKKLNINFSSSKQICAGGEQGKISTSGDYLLFHNSFFFAIFNQFGIECIIFPICVDIYSEMLPIC